MEPETHPTMLRAPYVLAMPSWPEAGITTPCLVLYDAPPWVRRIRIFQGTRNPAHDMILEANNPWRAPGERGFSILMDAAELPYLGSAIYEVGTDGRLKLLIDAYDSSD